MMPLYRSHSGRPTGKALSVGLCSILWALCLSPACHKAAKKDQPPPISVKTVPDDGPQTTPTPGPGSEGGGGLPPASGGGLTDPAAGPATDSGAATLASLKEEFGAVTPEQEQVLSEKGRPSLQKVKRSSRCWVYEGDAMESYCWNKKGKLTKHTTKTKKRRGA